MDKQTEYPGQYDLTLPVIGSFPNLITPRAVKRNGKETGEPKYGLSLEFEPDSPDFQALKTLAVKLARDKWPGRNLGQEAARFIKDQSGALVPKLPTFVFPWTDGNTLADQAKARGKDREWSRGKVVLKASSKFQPNLAILGPNGPVDLEDDAAIKAHASKFYSGSEYLVRINLQPYDKVGDSGADGVTAYLQMVLTLNRGKKLTKGRSAAEAFKGYAGVPVNDDPMEGYPGDMDEEIPF